MILKGPSLFGASFLLSWRSFKYFDSSHTFSPTLNGVNPYVIYSIIFCLASSCACMNLGSFDDRMSFCKTYKLLTETL